MKNVAHLVVVSLVGSLVACGGSTVVDSADDRRSPLGGVASAREGAEMMVPADATKLTLRTPLFGNAAAPPAGSECDRNYKVYVVDLEAKEMTWEDCENVASDYPYVISRGWTILNPAQVQAAKAAFEKLTSASGDSCNARVPQNEVSVTTPRGTTAYYDARSCSASDPKVSGIEQLFDDMYGVFALR